MQKNEFKTKNSTIKYWTRKGSSDEWVVFCHGAGVDHHMFDQQVAAVPEKYSILLWDIPHHGESQSQARFSFNEVTNDLISLLGHLGIDKACFIGQSMGGNIIQSIAKYHPGFVEGMVIIDSTRNFQKLTMTERFYARMTPFILKSYPYTMLISQSARACGRRKDTQQYVTECFERMPKESFIDVMTSLLTCIEDDDRYREACPMLLMYGEYDSAGNIRKSMKVWPGREAVMIPRAGHNANQDESARVNKLLHSFLMRDRARGRPGKGLMVGV